MMNIINPDALIAQKNLDRYHATGELDGMYLASLSADAIPYTLTLLNEPESEIKTDFERTLYIKYDSSGGVERNDTWQSTNLSRIRAKALLASQYVVLPHANTSEASAFDGED